MKFVATKRGKRWKRKKEKRIGKTCCRARRPGKERQPLSQESTFSFNLLSSCCLGHLCFLPLSTPACSAPVWPPPAHACSALRPPAQLRPSGSVTSTRLQHPSVASIGPWQPRGRRRRQAASPSRGRRHRPTAAPLSPPARTCPAPKVADPQLSRGRRRQHASAPPPTSSSPAGLPAAAPPRGGHHPHAGHLHATLSFVASRENAAL
jgi:hypothetical protein